MGLLPADATRTIPSLLTFHRITDLKKDVALMAQELRQPGLKPGLYEGVVSILFFFDLANTLVKMVAASAPVSITLQWRI